MMPSKRVVKETVKERRMAQKMEALLKRVRRRREASLEMARRRGLGQTLVASSSSSPITSTP